MFAAEVSRGERGKELLHCHCCCCRCCCYYLPPLPDHELLQGTRPKRAINELKLTSIRQPDSVNIVKKDLTHALVEVICYFAPPIIKVYCRPNYRLTKAIDMKVSNTPSTTTTTTATATTTITKEGREGGREVGVETLSNFVGGLVGGAMLRCDDSA